MSGATEDMADTIVDLEGENADLYAKVEEQEKTIADLQTRNDKLIEALETVLVDTKYTVEHAL